MAYFCNQEWLHWSVEVLDSAGSWKALMENSTDLETTQLIERASNGDHQAWDTIIKMWNHRLLAYCRTRVWGSASAEDAVQETWIKAVKNAETFRGKSGNDLLNWLIFVAGNESANQGRKAKRHSHEDIESLEAQGTKRNQGLRDLDRLMQSEQASALQGCLEELDSGFRQVITLRLDGASYVQISDSLGIPSGTVGTRISRGVQALNQCIERKLS